MHIAAIWNGPPLPPPASAPPSGRAEGPPPHPLDHATYDFPPASAGPYPYARFAGHLPALRLPAPPPAGFLTRCTARRAVVLWSVVDLWAFATALRLGPSPLAALALVGTVATCWHLRAVARRRTQVSRTTNALSPTLGALAPLGATARRGQRSRHPGRLHTRFSPRRVRRRRVVVGTRRPSDWWPARLSPAVLVAAASVVAGVVVHAASSGITPLH